MPSFSVRWFGIRSKPGQLFLKHNVLNICVFPTENNVSLFRILRLFVKDNYFWRNVLKTRYGLSYFKIAIRSKTIMNCCWLGGMRMELRTFHPG